MPQCLKDFLDTLVTTAAAIVPSFFFSFKFKFFCTSGGCQKSSTPGGAFLKQKRGATKKKKMEDMVAQLVAQNDKLMKQMLEMRQQLAKNKPQDEPQHEPTMRRATHPRTKPPKPAPTITESPRLRRSPRNHNSPGSSDPKTPTAGAAMRRRLSYTSAGGSSKKSAAARSSAGRSSSKKRRTTPTPPRQLVRQTLGDAIKLNMDELLLGQHFRDEHRFFKVDEFRQRVKPLIEAIENDDEVDTSMFTKQQLYALAINVGKKRDQYVPKKKQKLSSTKKRRLRKQKKLKKAAAARAAAAARVGTASDAGVDGAVASAAVSRARVATACSNDDVVAERATANAECAPEDQSTEDSDGHDDGSELRSLLQLDDDEQKQRNATKAVVLEKKKRLWRQKRLRRHKRLRQKSLRRQKNCRTETGGKRLLPLLYTTTTLKKWRPPLLRLQRPNLPP